MIVFDEGLIMHVVNGDDEMRKAFYHTYFYSFMFQMERMKEIKEILPSFEALL